MPAAPLSPERQSLVAGVVRRGRASVSKLVLNILIGIVAMLAATSTSAHHSHAMFDSQKQVRLVGTVKEFQWNNPHCWIQLLVPNPDDPKAAPVEWGLEMGAPLELFRHGWRPESVKPGDKITVVIYPLRDGRPGGEIVYAIGPDGKAIGRVPENVQSNVAAGGR
jgi:Family of unknown function (DUF6152)